MSRRGFVTGAGALLVLAPLNVHAQESTKVQRIGVLGSPGAAYFAAFEDALRELGYTPGRNIVFETRTGFGTSTELLAAAAGELVRKSVDVIVTGPSQYVDAAKQITSTVPIVMVYGHDPVGRGYATSLTRPGGNITGLVWNPTAEVFGKYVQFLSELLPRLSRIAGVVDPTQAYQTFWTETDTAAKRHGAALDYFEVRKESDVAKAFSTMASRRMQAVIIFTGPNLWVYRGQIADLAQRNRLPTVYMYREGPEAGGLLSYGISLKDAWRRAGVYVDKILKGAKPADLPISQPTTFELVINLKTAKALGLTIPPSLLLRADQVIE